MSTINLKKRPIDSSSDDSDDDIPLSQLKTEPQTNMTPPAIKAEPIEKKPVSSDETSDDEDDLPISALASKNTVVVKEEKPKVKKEPTTDSTKKSLGSKKKKIRIKYKQQECTEELYQSLKGRLVQELLCRWWYVIEWPPVNQDEEKPHGTQELDGFKGAYIRVKGEDMGSIIDTRTSQSKPSFLDLFALHSEEIQKLLVQAYKKQMEVLIEHEGEDAALLKTLKSALTSAEKISVEKAEKSVKKIFKKYQEFALQIQEVQDKDQ